MMNVFTSAEILNFRVDKMVQAVGDSKEVKILLIMLPMDTLIMLR